MKTAIVNVHELGTNCWSVARFVEGKRCPAVMSCKYPERNTCKAVAAEEEYLINLSASQQEKIQVKLSDLHRKEEI